MNFQSAAAALLAMALAITGSEAVSSEPQATSGAIVPGAEPLRVYILAGQSNMQGHAHVSTFDSMARDPATAPLLAMMRNADGTPKVCNRVWISSIGCSGDRYSDLSEQTGRLTAGFGASEEKIGPEFTFGLRMEQLQNGPILIIKTSWGGRSLHTDFRPPSAGPYPWSDFELARCAQRGDDIALIQAEKLLATGVFYRAMLTHVQSVLKHLDRIVPKAELTTGYKLSGFIWFQGFNDLVSDWTYDKQMEPGGYAMYGELMAHLIRDLRRDLAAPDLPVVIGVMGIGGIGQSNEPPQMHFRHAQAWPTTLAEFKDSTVAVRTDIFWDERLDALQSRMEQFNEAFDRKMEAGATLSEQALDEARQKAIAENFLPEELVQLKGASDAAYHYLGAAKIIAPIGKAFAEALIDRH